MRYKRESSNNLYKKQRKILKLFPMTLYLIEQIVIQNTFQLLSNESILKNYTSNLYLLLLYMNN